MPAVFSRASSSSNPHKRKVHLSYEEKSRLLRIGKRPRKGPFNSVVDPTGFGAGSAIIELSEAVKGSGKYDPWVEQDVRAEDELEGMEKLKRMKVKVCHFITESNMTEELTNSILRPRCTHIHEMPSKFRQLSRRTRGHRITLLPTPTVSFFYKRTSLRTSG